jgi:hypothetical protein
MGTGVDDEQRGEIVAERSECVGQRDRRPRDVLRLLAVVPRLRGNALGNALDERERGGRQRRYQGQDEGRPKLRQKLARVRRYDRRQRQRQHDEGEHAGADQIEPDIDGERARHSRRDRSCRARKQRGYADGREVDDPCPDLQAGKADHLHHLEKRALRRNRLDRDAEDDGEYHDRGHEVLTERPA